MSARKIEGGTHRRYLGVGDAWVGGGGGILLYISYTGMCRTLGYGFEAVLV